MGGVVSSNFGSGVSSNRISFEWSYADHPFEIKKNSLCLFPLKYHSSQLQQSLGH